MKKEVRRSSRAVIRLSIYLYASGLLSEIEVFLKLVYAKAGVTDIVYMIGETGTADRRHSVC